MCIASRDERDVRTVLLTLHETHRYFARRMARYIHIHALVVLTLSLSILSAIAQLTPPNSRCVAPLLNARGRDGTPQLR
jgi:hypothetical protein